jgi:hypothetical protein
MNNESLKKYIDSLNKSEYVIENEMNKLIKGKYLTQEKYELLLNEKIKSSKEEIHWADYPQRMLKIINKFVKFNGETND